MLLQDSGIIVIMVHPVGNQDIGAPPGYPTAHATNQRGRCIWNPSVGFLRIPHIIQPLVIKRSHLKIMHRRFGNHLSVSIVGALFAVWTICRVSNQVSFLRPQASPVNLIQKRVGRRKPSVSLQRAANHTSFHFQNLQILLVTGGYFNIPETRIKKSRFIRFKSVAFHCIVGPGLSVITMLFTQAVAFLQIFWKQGII